MESNEDTNLVTAVKEALEEGIPETPDGLRDLLAAAAVEAKRRRMRRLFSRWGRPALLAASLSVSLAFFAVFSGGFKGGPQDGMTDAIGLLCELDGVEGEGLSAESPGALLLAWQEAPCADLL